MASNLSVEAVAERAFRRGGPSSGQLAVTIVLAGSSDRGRRFEVDVLLRWALGTAIPLVVIGGAEPLRQHAGVTELASRLAALGRRVEIDTGGTTIPTPGLVEATDLFLVSPRLGEADRCHDIALASLLDSERAAFSFVPRSLQDLDELAELEQRLGLYPIWVTPADPALVETALRRGWHLAR